MAEANRAALIARIDTEIKEADSVVIDDWGFRVLDLLRECRAALVQDQEREDAARATPEPTEQPADAAGRLMLNAYGRACYDAGRRSVVEDHHFHFPVPGASPPERRE